MQEFEIKIDKDDPNSNTAIVKYCEMNESIMAITEKETGTDLLKVYQARGFAEFQKVIDEYYAEIDDVITNRLGLRGHDYAA